MDNPNNHQSSSSWLWRLARMLFSTSRWWQRTSQIGDVVLALICSGDAVILNPLSYSWQSSDLTKVIMITYLITNRRSVELAHSLGYKAVKTEATGLYSRSLHIGPFVYNYFCLGPCIFWKAPPRTLCVTCLIPLNSRKAFERLGFRVASEFLYSEYKVKPTELQICFF